MILGKNYNVQTTLRYKYILIGKSHEALIMNKKERMDVDKILQIYENGQWEGNI